MEMDTRFKMLFEPGLIGNLELKNRMIMAAMTTNFGTEEGFVTKKLIDYHRDRARGGVGLNILEATVVDFPQGRFTPNQLSIDDDKYIPGLQRLTEAIQEEGGKAAVQLHHCGRTSNFNLTGAQPVGPSTLSRAGFDTPRELSIREIEAIIARYGDAAGRAQRAGFDGVEIHACHDHLPAQFLSPFSNKRQDEYGGSLKNRARFLLEIIIAIRKIVGNAYPVWARINGETKINGRMSIDEPRELAQMLVKVGIDAIDVSTYPTTNRPPFYPVGFFLPLAEGIKKVVDVPIIIVGRMNPQIGESALREKKVDFISFGKALIADPEYPKKIAEGRMEDIRPCLGCIHCMDSVFYGGQSLSCMANARVGREGEYFIKRSKKSNKVVVVGGGPAGMEAARVAALRGYQVELYEKGNFLGGQLNLAYVAPYKGTTKEFRDYLERQIMKLGIQIYLNKDVKLEDIEKANPDAVVIATGRIPTIPDIPGIKNSKVVLADDVLSAKVNVGERVTIIGGGLIGCETAEYLADKDKRVTIIEILDEIALDVNPTYKRPLLEVLSEMGIAIFCGVKSQEVIPEGIVITTKRGEKKTIKVDTLVVATGSKPNRRLFNQLEGKVKNIYLAGDSVEPRRIGNAVAEGFSIANSIP